MEIRAYESAEEFDRNSEYYEENVSDSESEEDRYSSTFRASRSRSATPMCRPEPTDDKIEDSNASAIEQEVVAEPRVITPPVNVTPAPAVPLLPENAPPAVPTTDQFRQKLCSTFLDRVIPSANGPLVLNLSDEERRLPVVQWARRKLLDFGYEVHRALTDITEQNRSSRERKLIDLLHNILFEIRLPVEFEDMNAE